LVWKGNEVKAETIFLTIVLSIFAAAGSQELDISTTGDPMEKVVVLSYRNRTEADSLEVLEDLIRQAVANRLLSTGRVLLAPRDEVTAVLDTLVPGQGYLTNERQAYRVGQAVGAGTVIFGSYTRRGEVITIKTYIVDCTSLTVHTVEQPEPELDLLSGHVAIETARVVQGEVVGETPRADIRGRKPEVPTQRLSSSPAAHATPWVALVASVGLSYFTYSYHAKASDSWDEYRGAVEEHEISRLYNEASDQLLARNVLGALALGSVALTVNYWFAHDFGGSEQWASNAHHDHTTTWSAAPVLGDKNIGVVFSKRF
jgi:hypothetical protein